MSILKDLREMKEILKSIKEILTEDEVSELEKQYRDYKFFADSRGMKLLADMGLVDEYNTFMNECENILFYETSEAKTRVSLPKPSSALEAFKNKFKKFF